jgi:hypothetical protein
LRNMQLDDFPDEILLRIFTDVPFFQRSAAWRGRVLGRAARLA